MESRKSSHLKKIKAAVNNPTWRWVCKLEEGDLIQSILNGYELILEFKDSLLIYVTKLGIIEF